MGGGGVIFEPFFKENHGIVFAFSKNCYFLKMAITLKILVGISSNFQHSIKTSKHTPKTSLEALEGRENLYKSY